MKKRTLKNLRLTKSTISNLQSYRISGGTDVVTVVTAIDTILDQLKSRTGCSGQIECNSVQACPKTVAITRFVDHKTNPLTLCAG